MAYFGGMNGNFRYGAVPGGGYYNASRRQRWWRPQNDDERKKFESYKSDVKTFLTMCKEGVNIHKAYGEMADLMEGEIPYAKLGFKNFGEFLFHCDDILELRTGGMNGYYLFLRGRPDEETEHLRRLVEGQSNRTKYKGFKARLSNTRPAPSEMLLVLMTRTENDVPKQPPRAVRGRGGRSRRGGGRGRGRGSGRSTVSSKKLPAVNVLPNLRPFNPNDYPPPPGLVNAVSSALALDEDGYSDDVDGFEDEMDSSNPDDDTCARLANGAYPKGGEDIVDRKISCKPQGFSSNSGTSGAAEITITRNFVSQSKDENPIQLETVKTAIGTEQRKYITAERKLSSRNLTSGSPGVTPIPKASTSSAVKPEPKKFPILKPWNPPQTTNPVVLTQEQKTKATALTNINSVSSKHAPVATYVGTSQSYKRTADSFVQEVLKPPTRTINEINATGAEINPQKLGSNSLTFNEPQAAKSLKSLLSLSNRSDTNKVPMPQTTTHPMNPFVRSPTSSSGVSSSHYNVIKEKPRASTAGSSSQDTDIRGIHSLFHSQCTLSAKQSVAAVVTHAETPKQNISTTSNCILREKVITTSSPKSTEKGEIAAKNVAKQMNVCKDKEFNAKLIGADGYGFFYIHLDIPEILRGYEQLQRDIHEFYISKTIQKRYSLPASEIKTGTMVVAKVGGTFVRGQVDEKDSTAQICIIFTLEDHSFEVVKFENIYRIEAKFATRCSQAIMCCLAGLEESMMTGEIAEAFARTPLYPPHVKVRWVQDSEVYHVPIVKMTIFEDHDVLNLLRNYGGLLLKQLKSDAEKVERLKFQRQQMEILRRKCYIS